ncbi:MAG: cation:proton antiporter [Clostridia bacterium]
MLLSLALIFIFGLFFSKIFSFCKIPDVVGMIFAGIVLNFFGLLDQSIINISAELRQIALVIILTRAGLSLDFDKLKKVGRPAMMLSCVPALFEIVSITIVGHLIFNVPFLTSAILGCVVAAVSPAIIVPRMIKLQETGYGADKNIPELILTGASVDDIFVIILFYSFLNFDSSNLIFIPINIILGIVFGIISALILLFLLKKFNVSINSSTLIFLSTSFVLLKIEDFVSFSALLAIMVMGIVFYRKDLSLANALSAKFSGLWSGASIILFVLVGFSMNIEYALSEGVKPIILILICLIGRSLGTYLCLIGTNLNKNERIFCVMAYLPKATVQAAIGAIPLSLGVPYGELILTVSVISIVITAPLGAFLIDGSYKKLLQKH